MKTIGVICEYNPFHNGHARQLRLIRERFGADSAIICAMSGNYVQRGDVALFAKHDRAEAAVLCGADLVVELPISCALSSAEGFAAGGVQLLDALACDVLSFGSECGDAAPLLRAAELQLSPDFDSLLRLHLSDGGSYASARAAALRELGAPDVVTLPNNILGVEYCKAILRGNSRIQPMAIARTGAYHAEELDPDAPSASAIRAAICSPEQWKPAVPSCLHALYASAMRYSAAAGERAMLSRLRTLPDEAFRALPFGSEGLWSKLMKNCRSAASVEEILVSTKSKRYPRTRLQRMLYCAFLGMTEELMREQAPYYRILAFNQRGRALLHEKKRTAVLLDSGERPAPSAYASLERRAADLFSLFAEGEVAPGDAESRLRNRYVQR